MSVDLAQIVSDIKYKPGVKLSLWQPDSPFQRSLVVSIDCMDTDDWQAITPRVITVVHSTFVPEIALYSDEHAIAFIRQCIRNAELHEMDEWLRYQGNRLRNPHEPGDTFAL